MFDPIPNTEAQVRPGARGVRLLVGLFLIVVASLKLYGLSVSAMPQSGFFASPSARTAIIGWELLLGFWLTTGVVKAISWLAALGTFFAFTVVSGYFGLIGQMTCGCFGTIQASPWAAFVIDIAAIVALLIFRPVWTTTDVKPFAIRVATVGTASFGLIGILAVIGILIFGSLDAALANLRGEWLGATEYVDFGTILPGEIVERRVKITNYSARPIRLIGGTSDCSCVTTNDLPVTIPANNSTIVTLGLKTSSKVAGQFTRHAEISTDCIQHRKIKFVLSCYQLERP